MFGMRMFYGLERATYDTRKEISTLENGNFWSVDGRPRCF